MTAPDRATLATELLERLDTLRALLRLVATQEEQVRATWEALQALDNAPPEVSR